MNVSSAKDLHRAIADAFPQTVLDEGVLNEPTATWDSLVDGPQWSVDLLGKSWVDVTDAFLDEAEGLPICAGNQTFTLILPAMLRRLVNLKDGDASRLAVSLCRMLTPSRQRPRGLANLGHCMSILGDAQRAVLFDVLGHLSTHRLHEERASVALRELRDWQPSAAEE